MKFLQLAIAALSLPFVVSKSVSTSELNKMIADGRISREELLANAIPLKRDLQNQNDGYNDDGYNNGYDDGYNNGYHNGYNNEYYNEDDFNQQDQGDYTNPYSQDYAGAADEVEYYGDMAYSVGGYYDQDSEAKQYTYADFGVHGLSSIRFNSCMSMAVQDNELMQNDVLLKAAQEGSIIAQQSYVLFDVGECYQNECTYNRRNTYMIPLENFMRAMVNYFPNEREEYCAACGDFRGYCRYGNGAYFSSAEYANGGDFCYEGEEYKLIDCQRCARIGCFSEDGGNTPAWYGGKWIEQLSQCRATNNYWQGQPLYSGLMCNEDGDGVEIGVFVDNQCRYYDKLKNFQKVMEGNDWYYYNKMPNVIQQLFTDDLSCQTQQDFQWYNAYEEVHQDDGQCPEEVDINYSCQDLFSDHVTRLRNCKGNNGNTWNKGDNSENRAMWKDFDLYPYDLTDDQMRDQHSVCKKIRWQYSGLGHHRNVYDEASSGTMFDYSQASGIRNIWGARKKRLSRGDKRFFGSVVALIACIGLYFKYRHHQTKPRDVVISADKKLPLVS